MIRGVGFQEAVQQRITGKRKKVSFSSADCKEKVSYGLSKRNAITFLTHFLKIISETLRDKYVILYLRHENENFRFKSRTSR
jgi:hypothetical protein